MQGLSTAGKEFDQQQRAASANIDDWSTQKVSGKVQSDIAKAETAPEDTGIASDIQAFQDVQAKNKAFQGGFDTAAKNLSEIASYSPATQTLNEAKQKAILTGTESGRATLLRGGDVQSTDVNNPNAKVKITGGFQRPDYSTGQVNLDQLLTQNAPQNAQKLSNLRNSLLGQYGLANQENQAIQTAAASRQGAIQGTSQAAGNIQKVLYGLPEGEPTPQGEQYGVLSNYYKQLQNAPTAANEAQQANLTQAQQQVKDYIQQQYGNQLYGANIDELVKSIVSPTNTIGNANVANVMNTPQLNKLQVLNKLAGLTDNNINQIGQTGVTGTQVIDPTLVGKTVFDPNATSNWQAGGQILNQAQQKFASDVQATAQSAVANQTPVYGQTFGSAKEAAQYAANRVNSRMKNATADAQENQKVSADLTKQLNKIDQIRQTAGIGAFNGQPPQEYIDQAKNSVLTNMINDYAKETKKGRYTESTDPKEQAAFVNNFMQEVLPNLPYFGQALGRSDWRQAIDAATQSLALSNLLNDLQQNPYIQTTGKLDVGQFGQGQPTVINANNPATVTTPAINPMRT